MVRAIAIFMSVATLLCGCGKLRKADKSTDAAAATEAATDAVQDSSSADDTEAADAAIDTGEEPGQKNDTGTPGVPNDASEDSDADDDSSAANNGEPDTDSKCSETPTLLIDQHDLLLWGAGGSDISAGFDLAVSDTDLYIATESALLRVPIRGGRRVRMTSIVGSTEALLLTGDSVVVASSYRDENEIQSGEIVRMDLQGDDKTVLATAPITHSTIFGPHGILATDGQNVYFAAQDGTRRVSLEGGEVEMLTTRTGPLAVIGSNLVIADESEGALVSFPLEGGPATTLAAHLTGTLGHVQQCETDICWTSTVHENRGFGPNGTMSLMRLDSSGEPMSIFQSSGLYGTIRLVYDESGFFATVGSSGSPGVLVRIEYGDDEPVFMGGGAGIAVDEACLYTGTVLGGIYSIAKSYRGDIPLW
jgi:uncharacterized protein YceK